MKKNSIYIEPRVVAVQFAVENGFDASLDVDKTVTIEGDEMMGAQDYRNTDWNSPEGTTNEGYF